MKLKSYLILLLLTATAVAADAQTQEECMEFLYKYMPLPDKVDYPRSYYEENVATSLRARQELPWGEVVPKREFMHFVLPVRVNNENLDTCRMVFYRELKSRVEKLSMADAILEVNHWCHEHVTYTPSDERTSSPLATLRTAYGRCGEESTFLVAALRSVGIPARQVYTPRWAHTDDNHAWVEAWADGTWHFLGACEPEPVLDLGWFNAPASRGMLMDTKVFGLYDGPEEVMLRTPCYTEIDVTANYAPVTRRMVKVVDTEGRSVEGATVEFKLYNYAEFYTVSKKLSDASGMTYMQSGKGDLLVWAHKGDRYGFVKCSMKDSDVLVVTLDKVVGGEPYSLDLTIVPPVERNTIPPVTDAMRAGNSRRLADEDAIRNAYIASFPDSNDEYIRKSRGNYKVISAFLARKNLSISPSRFLSTLSDKDLRDVTSDVLLASTSSVVENSHGYPEEIYYKYVLCPRVANEGLTPYMLSLRSQSANLRLRTIDAIIQWVKKNISIDETSNPQHLRMSPMGVFRNRVCDAFSRNIFFVALARAHGYAARIDAVTQKVEYYDGGEWKTVDFEKKTSVVLSTKGTIKASYAPDPDEYNINPKYYTHFTLSRLDGGAPELMNYGEDDTWQSTLAKGVSLDAGQYMLTSGTRMADGSVKVHIEVANVGKDECLTLPLVLPEAQEGYPVIGNFNSENLYNADGKEQTILSTTGRGYYVLGFIQPNNEPTNHALRDIAAVKSDFDALGVHLVLLFKDDATRSRFHAADLPTLPANTHFGTDINDSNWNELCTNLHLSSPTYPVFIIADTFNRLVFISKGYTIGLGDRLLKCLNCVSAP